jgi:gliding motility-associated-like protein
MNLTRALALFALPTLSIITLFSLSFINKQKHIAPPAEPLAQEAFCGSDAAFSLLKQNDPTLTQWHDQLEKAYVDQIKSGNKLPEADFTLPVVVHIIHDNGPENITNAQVEQGIADLNEAFANMGYYDQGTGVNTQIEFCLAKRDPDGNPTTGITRDISSLTEMTLETDDIAVKDLNRWEPTEYINIWLVREICSFSAGCGVAGYAYFPSSHGQPEDGIMVEAQWFGSSQSKSTIHTHEMGHYLGLYHTFEGGCQNNNCLTDGDRVCDTPPDQTIVPVPCNSSINSCSTDANSGFSTDQDDQFYNYMDYGDYNCYSAFSQGQTDRMTFFINGTRASLLGSDGCVDPCPNPIDIAFSPGDTIVDEGSTIDFINTTIGATDFEWSLDGNPIGNTQNLSYTFNSGGTYEVALTASNGDPNCTITQTINLVVVGCSGSAHVSDLFGNDTPDCGDPANPCKTIQYALDFITCSGDTVFIHSGTYSLPSAADPLQPVARIPQNTSVTFFGVEDAGPVIIDGQSERRGFQYYYLNSSCPDSSPADNIDLSVSINFAHLSIQNCFYGGGLCGSVYNAQGAGIQLFNNDNSQLYLSIRDCQFLDNRLEDYSTLNNNGRSTSGAAVYINGRVGNNQPAVNEATALIENCSFVNNRCDQNDNGGHGGAVYFGALSGGEVLNSYFCNNSTFSTNSDNGDLEFDRNAGGGLFIFDPYSNSAGHEYLVDNCIFVGNSATTEEGIGFINQSEGGGFFFSDGGFTTSNSLAVVNIENCRFYDNTVETGIEHYDSNGGTVNANANNIFQDDFSLDVVDDNVDLCAGGELSVSNPIPQAEYDWSTGDSGPTTFADADGTYSVTITLGGCEAVDSVQVNLIPCAEDCDNGLDDDGDGLVDCEDPDCDCGDCNNPFLKIFGTSGIPERVNCILAIGNDEILAGGAKEDSILLFTINPNGELLWSRSYKFTAGDHQVNGLSLDSEGYVLGAGVTQLSSGVNDRKGFAFRLDPQTQAMDWVHLFENSNNPSQGSYAYDLVEHTPGGDYFLTGQSYENTSPGQSGDGFWAELNRNTGLIIDGPKNYNIGSSETFGDIEVIGNAVFVTGRYNFSGGGTNKMRNAITRLDFDGNEIWTRLYLVGVDPFENARLYCHHIQEVDGDLVTLITGDKDGSATDVEEWFLMKTDQNGEVIWVKEWFFGAGANVDPLDFVPVNDGFYILSVEIGTNELILSKADTDGNHQWSKRYDAPFDLGGTFSFEEMLIYDGYLYFAARVLSNGNVDDIAFFKTDLEGNLPPGCINISDFDPVVSDFNDPYQGLHPLTVYDIPFDNDSDILASGEAPLPIDELCTIPCAVEDCDNGLDDDGDGLVDIYDPDCPCQDEITCGSSYYNYCVNDCPFSLPIDTFSMNLAWTQPDVPNNQVPMVADVDGDCIPDIVTVNFSRTAIRVYNSSDGTIKYSYPLNIGVYSQLALGDVDEDGMAEIFVNGNIVLTPTLIRLDYDSGSNSLVNTWNADTPTDTNSSTPSANFSPSLADFNFDGKPEVYIGNQVFDSATGLQLVFGGNGNNQGTYPLGSSNFMTSVSIAGDVLEDAACPDCAGLELVAGGQVYAISINSYTDPSQNTIQVVRDLGTPDGATRLADFDRDGDLDAVVSYMTSFTSGDHLMVWDLQTESYIGNAIDDLPNQNFNERIGPPTIGDVDGDGWPEIIIATSFNFTVVEDYLNGGGAAWGNTPATIKATLPTSDQSGATGITVSDLNGDGAVEILYRDMSDLRVFDQDLNVLSSFACNSGTATEYPVIADIDGDEETELLCTCQGSGLNVFTSANLPWVRTRKIWNQFNYFVVNVNDDGSVPPQQQLHHIVKDSIILNNFLQQQAYLDQSGAPFFPENQTPCFTDEICDNGIDDDGDGLIDCFDPDCCDDCDDFYYNPCPEACLADSIIGPFEMQLQWANSDEPAHEYSVPVVGDLDGDNIPEVVMRRGPHNPVILYNQGLIVYDGATGAVEETISTPFMLYFNGGVAIADMDKDGFGEIVMASSAGNNAPNEQRRLICYEYDGSTYTQKWISDQPYGYTNDHEGWTPAIADFNEDGIPEVYIMNQVFNGLTGEFITEGGNSNSLGSSLTTARQGFTVAADVLPDNFCANCSGLELIAGNQVYSVNIGPGPDVMNVEVEAAAEGDGQTAIADLDKDGDLDAIIGAAANFASQAYVYAWDLQTADVLATSPNYSTSAEKSISLPNVADFDADGLPEIGISTPNFYRVLEQSGNTLTELWTVPTSDNSGRTGSTVFDFNSDGEYEVVYRSQNFLVILEGSTGTILSQIPCQSGTGVEYPITVDVDGDNQTEVLCGCETELRAYRSGQTPWVPARPVWNQLTYFNANINDDLTVPQEQQLHHIVGDSIEMNNFLVQYADPDFLVPDAVLAMEVVDCTIDSLYVAVELCNNGDAPLPASTPLAIYNDDPTTTAATLIDVLPFGQVVPKDTCIVRVIPIQAIYLTPVFAVINDNGSLTTPFDLEADFPVTEILECDYTNNIDSFLVEEPAIPLDLGPDTSICDNGVLELTISSGYKSIKWQDGSMDTIYTVWAPGTYWVEVTDGCSTKSDTIVVALDTATVLDLGPDILLCNDDSATISATGFDHYEWIPSDFLNCDTCATVISNPPDSVTYTVIASLDNGCFSVDTITVRRALEVFFSLDTTICEGESVVFGGLSYSETTMISDTSLSTAGCDSISSLNLTVLPVDTTLLDTAICVNEVLIYDGVIIAPGETTLLEYSASNGCDSFLLIQVGELLLSYELDTISICFGDTIDIFGEAQWEPGLYENFLTGANGCDSTLAIELLVQPPITASYTAEPSCGDNPDGSAEVSVSGGSPPYSYTWNVPEGEGPNLEEVPAGIYSLTITDANNCTEELEVVVPAFEEPDWTLLPEDISCFGLNDGSIAVITDSGVYEYSLDGESFGPDSLFVDLGGGFYDVFLQDTNACIYSQQVEIIEPDPWEVQLPADTTLELGQSVEINAETNAPGIPELQWFPFESLDCPDCLNPVATPEVTTTYTLTVIDPFGCVDSASITVNIVITCNADRLLIPNVFTPNNDGVNDYFEIVNKDALERINSFRIFDRWGELVFEESGIQARWDGKMNGKDMPSDTYVYLIEFSCPDGQDGQAVGDVTLIR